MNCVLLHIVPTTPYTTGFLLSLVTRVSGHSIELQSRSLTLITSEREREREREYAFLIRLRVPLRSNPFSAWLHGTWRASGEESASVHKVCMLFYADPGLIDVDSKGVALLRSLVST